MKDRFVVVSLFSFFICSASASADPASADSPGLLLRDCRETTPRPGERKFQCPGFSANMSVEQPAFAAEQIVELTVNGIQQDPRLKVDRAAVLVNGEKRPGARYTALGPGGETTSAGVFAMVPAATPGKIRLVGCEEKSPALCNRVLGALSDKLKDGDKESGSQTGPEKSPQRSVGTLKFAGRSVAVPQGCTSAVEGPRTMIRCQGANVSWVSMQKDDPAGSDWIYQPIKKSLATQGKLTEKIRPCLVGAAPTECRDLTVARENQAALNATAAMAQVGDERVWVQCNAVDRRDDKLPQPCAEIVQFSSWSAR